MIQVHFLTLFPDFIESGVGFSILKKANQNKQIKFIIHDLRKFGIGKRKTVDSRPVSGGPGMVLRVDVMAGAIAKIKGKNKKIKVILLTPQGRLFNQELAKKLAEDGNDFLLIAGHYEGFDERIRDLVDMELSIGEYVTTGGELPALVVADAVCRLLPGVLGNNRSHLEESFNLKDTDGKPMLEYPQYTKPLVYKGKKVPEILLSGDHAKISQYKLAQANKKTKLRSDGLQN